MKLRKLAAFLLSHSVLYHHHARQFCLSGKFQYFVDLSAFTGIILYISICILTSPLGEVISCCRKHGIFDAYEKCSPRAAFCLFILSLLSEGKKYSISLKATL